MELLFREVNQALSHDHPGWVGFTEFSDGGPLSWVRVYNFPTPLLFSSSLLVFEG